VKASFPSEVRAFRAIGLRTVPRWPQGVDTPIGTSREVQGAGGMGLTGVKRATLEDSRCDVVFASHDALLSSSAAASCAGESQAECCWVPSQFGRFWPESSGTMGRVVVMSGTPTGHAVCSRFGRG